MHGKLPLSLETPYYLYILLKAFRRIYSLVKEYSPLLYIFELALAGMKDGPVPHSHRSVIGRLQLLSSYRKEWPALAWSHEYKVLISASTRSGISGGFLHQIRAHGMQYTLELTELPSFRTARPPSMTRHLKFVTPEIENVALDCSQSLIVSSHILSVQNGIGVVLYFRDLWTFGKHPRAYSGTYDFNVGHTPIVNVSMVICGHKMAISFELSGGRAKHLILNWRTFQAGWLEDNDIQFLNENRLLVVRRSRGLPVLSIYNISNIGAVAIERDYELPEAWNRSIIGFGPNTSPVTDQYPSADAMFYPDPSKRVLLLAVKTPSPAGGPSIRNWLIINESYFRPTSRKDRLRVSWYEWSQACLIRDVYSSVRGPYVNGNRVVYLENPSRSSRGTAAPRLNIIEFAPYPDSECLQSRAWSLAGPRSVLVPNEITREVPHKTVDGRQVEDIRLTEDNIVLFLSGGS
ncbi:hypothetical protein H0H81_001657 [Sphagnurus paluster]|uniref:Uncharacterized protein n=1 Tax=Sphagnurus paluster TaxID=117069 RepID=A0A9P7FU15_9AGAR|nr:hypothetical protein H0H81_001657 [Sphagnurus paluster]